MTFVSRLRGVFQRTAGPASANGDRPSVRDALVQRAMPEAETGRRLAIYNRETGLLAYWYIALRGDEECYRAGRYSRPLTMLIAEPAPGSEEWTVADSLTKWLASQARQSDVAGYLGNARFVLLMPETRLDSARKLAARLQREIPALQTGLSGHPVDGQDYQQLMATAVRRLRLAARPAA